MKRCAFEQVAEGEGLVAVTGPSSSTRPISRARVVVVIVVPTIAGGGTSAAVTGVGAAVAAAAGRGLVECGPGIVDPALTC